ncbi:TIR domain-containing protein [Streptomyces griseorubiginosus]|uniref:TIR domain-containing protein n=1 Tax=Streptomyces griseorubiginosus TaxID=67304 RepID=UPI0036EAC8F6
MREFEVGEGVIDCAIDSSNDLLLVGDVSGRAMLMERDLGIAWETELDLPIWGVDLAADRQLAAFALADKPNFKGALVVFDYGKNTVKARININSPGWDVIFDPTSQTVYMSSWGDGIVWADLSRGTQGSLNVPGHVFGMRWCTPLKDEPRMLTATLSGIGVIGIDLPNGATPRDAESAARMLLRSEHSCYKHAFNVNRTRLFVGSSTSLASFSSRMPESPYRTGTQSFRTHMSDVCGVACTDKLLVQGSLSGQIQVSRIEKPELVTGFSEIGCSVWSIDSWGGGEEIVLARGDGFISEYSVASLEADSEIRSVRLGPGSLRGAQVFLSYASEDFAEVEGIYRHLKSLGCAPWMDRFDILPGQDWEHEIRRALQESDFIVVCFSPNSVSKRGYIQKEVRVALQLLEEVPEGEIFVIPARLRECVIPQSLSRRQWVDLFAEDGFHRLCSAIYVSLMSRDGTNP